MPYERGIRCKNAGMVSRGIVRSMARGAALSVAMLLCGALSVSHAQLTADKNFRKTAQAAQSSLEKGDMAAARAYISSLAPNNVFESYMAASFQLELALKQGDILTQRLAVARVLESGGVPQEQLGYLNYLAGYLSYQTGATDNAIIYLERARALGGNDIKALLLLSESYARQGKVDQASAVADEAINAQKSAGQTVPVSWYDRAASLAHDRKNWSEMARYGAASLAGPGTTAAQWRTALVAYGTHAKPDDEALLDLYRLQAATDALASERDYHEYAQLAGNLGYAAEAKAVIEAGQSSGALLQSDRVAQALAGNNRRKAVVQLSALRGLAGKADGMPSALRAMQNADMLFAVSQYSQAIPYYRAALEKPGVDRDRVTARLGIALARAGDLDGAIIALAQATGAWSDVATYWTAWTNNRRNILVQEQQPEAVASAQ